MPLDLNALLGLLSSEPVLAIWREWLARAMREADAREAAVHPATERATARRAGSIAVVPVRGVITPRSGILELYGLATSTETIIRGVRAALADPEVKVVVLDVDSPGGTVSGVPELAAEIHRLRGAKPIIAHADYLAASAAYWIASQADDVIASPSALVGSIGVFTLHLDFSGFLEAQGITPTFIASAPEKVDGNPFQPLSKTGEAELRAIVDGAYRMFVDAVSRGRGVPPATVRDDYGKGHLLTAGDALAAGMVDKIRTLDETLAAYGVAPGAVPRPAGHRALALARRTRELALIPS